MTLESANAKRPIEPPEVWKTPDDCEHPWHRLAVVNVSSLLPAQRAQIAQTEGSAGSLFSAKCPDPFTFQCGDCGVLMRANGYLFIFDVV